jgi:hypothetical protein
MKPMNWPRFAVGVAVVAVGVAVMIGLSQVAGVVVTVLGFAVTKTSGGPSVSGVGFGDGGD